MSGAPVILIVDDTPSNLIFIGDLLKQDYIVRVASNGRRALEIVHTHPKPALILLDVLMPDMDGYAVLEQLRKDPTTADIPVIILTSLGDTDQEAYGLEHGAIDFLVRPLHPTIVRARVKNQLELKLARDQLRDQKKWLEEEVERRIQELSITQDISIQALACLAETRDPDTGNHLKRTENYVRTLAKKVQAQEGLSDAMIPILARSAILHDIGKVGIPDSILLKPGKLTPEEWVIMRTHTTIGYDALVRAEQQTRESLPFLSSAKEIARHHHERWDGSGYPDHLAGTAIPLSARIMAIGDVFDALVCPRVYKKRMSFREARTLIESESGRHFDPNLVAAFLSCYEEFKAIALQFADAPEPE